MRKLRKYTDGQTRITMKVEHTVSIVEMAQYFTAWNREESVEEASRKSKKDIIKDITSELRSSGEEISGYSIGDNDLNDVMDGVVEVFKVKFAREFNL